MEGILTLRIKRKYLEAIRAGTKKVEYREASPYYKARLERPGVEILRLHYQTADQVICEVKKVLKIKRPDHLSAAAFGPEVYAIHLGRCAQLPLEYCK